jgi:ABC-type uncharacterized transport system substrate-binding protein
MYTKNQFRIIIYQYFIVIVISSIVFAPYVCADNFSINPRTDNGKKFRIAYFEGGEYIVYQTMLLYIAKGLMEIGWAEMAKIPDQKGEQTDVLWKWLCKNIQSKYIEFVDDAHYTCNWDDHTADTRTEQLITRLDQDNDLDMIIAMGTMAGQKLSNERHKTPVIVVNATDAVGAEIIKSVEDSGYDHVNAHVDPFRYERQIKLFHDIIGFKKLGMIYENTIAGRSYAALEDVEKVAKERGFEIVSCYAKADNPDFDLAEKDYLRCLNKICLEVDAMYITGSNGVTESSRPKIIKILNKNKIPSFSQTGSFEVKDGILLSISQESYKYVGIFHAETMARIFNGALPRQLTQIFEEPPKIAINLKTAEIISYDPPVDILAAADEIFQSIR